ncbi:serine racemase isoform X2 [Catharus ustulatus]|uniref:serine racemase isoform X2 n=1 Tax=Catharus ustulatus TaxID=91951 RepID=UPI0014097E05|nr:serine racemase isoform X2 [Catharus ustulatus]
MAALCSPGQRSLFANGKAALRRDPPGLRGRWEEDVEPSTHSPVLSLQIRGALNAGFLPILWCPGQPRSVSKMPFVPMVPHWCRVTPLTRAETASAVVQETGGVLVHPNQEPAVIAGQGTIALEVLEQAPQVNAVVVPVGGGGMVAGIAVAIKALRPDVKVFAAEPSNVDDCYQSKVRGELTPNLHPRDTIADAVKTSIGPNTWPIIRDLVDDVLIVSEEEIKRATWLVWERMKLLIEPTAGVGLAAVLSEQFQAVPGDVQNVCIVLCGGNVDLRSLTWLTDLSGKAE